MLAGHIDEIGRQITHVATRATCIFAGIGGGTPGPRGTARADQRLEGCGRAVIGKQAVHLMETRDMDKVSKITDL